MENNNYTITEQRKSYGFRKVLLSVMLMVLSVASGFAQVSTYTFAQSTGTYSPITGGTQLYSGNFDDGSTNFNLPFSFTYNGAAYTNVWTSANGYIVFGGASDPTGGSYSSASVISGTLVTTGAVAGWAGDLSGWTGTVGGQTSQVRAEVIGSSPNRVAVFQWRSRPSYSTSGTSVAFINFQIRLNESNNNVQIVYGASGMLLGTTNSSTSRQVGLRGPSNTQFNNRTNSTTVSFNSSTAGTLNSNTQAFTSVNATPGRPTNGLTYTWAPPLPCTAASGGTVTPATASLCAGQTYTLTAVGATQGTGITYQWEVSTTGGGVGFASVSGGTGATTVSHTTAALAAGTYYYRLRTTCATGPIDGYSNEVAVVVNALPTITVTGSNGGNFCGNGTLTATGASTYSWTPANAVSPNTGSTVTSVATSSQTFTVVGTDVNGCTSSATFASTYSSPSLVTVTAAEGGVFCGTGGTTTIEATSNASYNYTFTAIDGAVLSNITANMADVTVTQTSAVQVDAVDPSTGCATTAYVSIGVYPLPTATVTTTASGVCPGTSATINSGLTAGNFTVSSIPVVASVAPATATVLMNNGNAVTPLSGGSLDDGGWGGIPIGFDFNFFGTTFNTLAAGTNGLLMFGTVPGYGTSAGQLGQYTFQGPPFFPNTNNPGNIIALMAADLHMGTNTTNASIRYWTQGYAPNRVFIIKYTNVNGYSANPAATVEARLYETLGMVDIVITNKTFSNSSIVGLQNATKTIGAVAPGRAGGTWTVTTPEAWRFNPPANYTTVWYANGVEIANGTNIFSQSVAPTATTSYEIIYTNQLTLCSNESGSAVVNMAVLSPNPPTGVNTVGPASVCPGGSIALSTDYTGSLDGLSFQWEVSTDGGATWSAIAGATSTTATASQTVSSSYRCAIVSCGSAPSYSSDLAVSLDPAPIAGSVSGPSTAVTSVAQLYITDGSFGPLQWLFKASTATTWSVVANATNDTLSATFGAPGTFDIRVVAGAAGCTIDSSNIITTVVTLGNDDVCSAYPVSIGNNGPYTNSGATLQPGESVPPVAGCSGNASWCTAADNTVWFSFTVPAGGSGRYGFAVPGWDSEVAVWSASACGDLTSAAGTLLAANDDSSGASPFNAYATAFCLTPGTTYYIQVDGYGTSTNGAFTLRIDDFGPAPSAAFTGLPATLCQSDAAVTLTAVTAGGTFSGPGVSGSTFDPAVAGAGVHTVTYTLGGQDVCVSTSQQITVTPVYTYYADIDQDTYGNAASSVQSCDATAPAGYVSNSTDCNDSDAAVNPAATEVCNAVDDNCDGQTDEGVSTTYFADADGDGYGVGNGQPYCTDPGAGFSISGGDCNDAEVNVNPGVSSDGCNNIDDNCDGATDEDAIFVDYYVDADGDGFGTGAATSSCTPISGSATVDGDCNDADASVNPGVASDLCDNVDNDCDGATDEDATFLNYYVDADGDGFGTGSATSSCSAIAGSATADGDCNDANASINPGVASDLCDNVDNDCDGATDEDATFLNYYVDADGDGFGTGAATSSCSAIAGSATADGDCNDSNADINPGEVEVCNGVDDDCAGGIDNGLTFVTYYQDADQDGFGNAAVSQTTCNGAPAGYITDNTDCNDAQILYADTDGDGFGAGAPAACGVTSSTDCDNSVATTYPGALEICNSVDDDCNNLVDDNTPLIATPAAILGTANACLPAVAGTATFSVAAIPYATTYVWTVPSGLTITAGQGTSTITVSYIAAGIEAGITGQICVYAANNCRQGATTCQNISFQNTAPLTPGAISGNGKVCPGEVLTYSVASQARATSYIWTVATGMTIQSGQGTNLITVAVGAGFTGGNISVAGSNVCGTSPLRTRSIALNPTTTPGIIAGAINGLCNTNGNVYSITPVSNATSYNWTISTGTGSVTIASGQGTNSISVNYGVATGTRTISVQAVNLCGSSAARTLTVRGAPPQPGTITGLAAVCRTSVQPYSVATVTGASSYNWIVTSAGAVTGGQGTKNASVTWNTAATAQQVAVNASNACGTSANRARTGITVTNCVRTGDLANAMSVYPNPASDFVNVEFNAEQAADYRLRLTDMSGRLVFAQESASDEGLNKVQIATGNLESGIYMVTLEFNGVQQVTRLVVN